MIIKPKIERDNKVAIFQFLIGQRPINSNIMQNNETLPHRIPDYTQLSKAK